VRCALTPDAKPIVIVPWGLFFQGTATIKAGQAVQFHNIDNEGATVTEGTNGKPVADPCIDKRVEGKYSLVVTFYKPGDYHIFCRAITSMHTVIHVQ
jgi:plastocyanin